MSDDTITITGSSNSTCGTLDSSTMVGTISVPSITTMTTNNTLGGFFGGLGTGAVGGGGAGQIYTTTSSGTGWTGTGTTFNSSSNTFTFGKGGKPVLSTEKNDINLDELADFVKIMRERMLILVPDFEKHEKYAALKKAYDNYKMIEALLQEEKKDDK